MNKIKKALQAQDYEVYCCPEVPTILIEGGCSYPGLSDEKRRELLEFEINLMKLQLQLEDRHGHFYPLAYFFTNLTTNFIVTSILLHPRIRKHVSFSIEGASTSLHMYQRQFLTKL